MSQQNNNQNESAEIIGQLNEEDQENQSEPIENIDTDAQYKLFRSQINQIVSKALGKEISNNESANTQNNEQIKEKSEITEAKKINDSKKSSKTICEVNENKEKKDEMSSEMRFKLYKLKVREIVSKALGKDNSSNKVVESSNFENENQIKAKSIDTESNIKVSKMNVKEEECQTIMKVESTEVITTNQH